MKTCSWFHQVSYLSPDVDRAINSFCDNKTDHFSPWTQPLTYTTTYSVTLLEPLTLTAGSIGLYGNTQMPLHLAHNYPRASIRQLAKDNPFTIDSVRSGKSKNIIASV